MSFLSDYFGRVHPLLLHFPVALLLVGALAEAIRAWRESPFLEKAVLWLMGLGAVAAWLTAGSGWVLASHEHIRVAERTTLEWHRWVGFATGVMAGAAWYAALVWRNPSHRWLRHGAIGVAAGLVIAAGHLGALIVWGQDWFS